MYSEHVKRLKKEIFLTIGNGIFMISRQSSTFSELVPFNASNEVRKALDNWS